MGTGFATCIVALAIALTLLLPSTNAFLATTSSSARVSTTHLQSSSSDKHNNLSTSSRRAWLTNAFLSSTIALLSTTHPANAVVYADPDRYGDKELKIATVNKLRQNIRNIVTEDPRLAPLFVQVAILDALSYNKNTQAGGPNGCIVSTLLKNENEAALQYAAQRLTQLRADLQQTTEITMADVVTLAGAEAIETMGGPRVVVQLGKLDPKNSDCNENIQDLGNGPETVQAFLQAGLTEREVALLFGAIASMDRLVATATAGNDSTTRTADDYDDYDVDNEMGDPQVNIPSSFGAPSEIYGKQLGQMDNSIFATVVALRKTKKATGVWTDDNVGEWATKYAKSGFLKDLPQAYSKLVGVGLTYTGGKVGNLIGTGENDV